MIPSGTDARRDAQHVGRLRFSCQGARRSSKEADGTHAVAAEERAGSRS